MSKGTCFIVSPIGDETKSPEIRQHFEVIKRIVNTVCADREIDLDTISAVDIAANGDINEEILEHLREDVFCIVNLDGLNPNVMYELGIRVQIGRPFVSIAPKHTKLPFDRISKRTLFFGEIYSDIKEYNKLEDDLKRAIIETIEKYTYVESNPIPTNSDIMKELSSLHTALRETIRETIHEMNIRENEIATLPRSFASEYEDVMAQLTPEQAVLYSIENKRIRLLEQILNDYPELTKKDDIIRVGASIGSVALANILKKQLPEVIKNNDIEQAIKTVGVLVNCYNINDLENQERGFIDDTIEQLMKFELSNKQKAVLLCQQERLYSGAGDLDRAIELAESVVKLDDEIGSYFYNYALLLRQRNADNDLTNAIAAVKRMLLLDKNDNDVDIDHLKLAYIVLSKSSKAEDQSKSLDVYDQLKKISPLQAKVAKLEFN